ncbi:hypothetical protein [Blastopirellula marina]|uniref:Uncharacterized protein n=1 Tax=Blastopirellula marina DSM 3645 TaxID=314230 RepID=A3ZNJ5_9BACT|nr:hypothetical protein [Blastopirellula marina]EAQ81890.1 hypothetical protein DSM3645_17100 [Blastopirellula marina DSM 3645]
MKYVEFENQLQDLLDERRLSDVGQLLARVDSADRDRCERLAAAYDTLFDGLESWDHPSGDQVLADRVIQQVQSLSAVLPPLAAAPVAENRTIFGQAGAWLPIAALALAASLLILAFIPFSLRQERDDRIGTYVATTDGQPDLNFAMSDDSLELLDWEDAKYVSPVRSPFDLPWELTSDLVVSTTTAPRLPLDPSSLAVTSIDTNPWINSFRPLTQSMGSALMVIKDATLPHSTSRNNAEAKPQARGATLPTSLGRRVT